MRNLAITLLMVWCVPTLGLDLSQADKQTHATASAAITAITYAKLRDAKYSKGTALAIAAVAALGMGVAKELMDKQFDSGDMQANMLGVSVSAVVLAW